MGITSWELGVSLVGSMLIFIAFIETGVILAGCQHFSFGKQRKTPEKNSLKLEDYPALKE
jgi:hypothetical protein